MRLTINASNVSSGGGRTLLIGILESLSEKYPVRLFVDARFDLPFHLPKNVFIHRVAPIVWQRFVGEWRLRKTLQPHEVVLCLGNLPPLFKSKGDVFLFVQNRYLIEKKTLTGLESEES